MKPNGFLTDQVVLVTGGLKECSLIVNERVMSQQGTMSQQLRVTRVSS